jgi:hypothetical protein
MTLLIMQFSPTSRHFISLRSKYFQHPVLSTLSLCSSLNVRDQVSHPYRTTGRIIILCIVIFMFWAAEKKTEGSGLHGSRL